jgi:hypothetical protein
VRVRVRLCVCVRVYAWSEGGRGHLSDEDVVGRISRFVLAIELWLHERGHCLSVDSTAAVVAVSNRQAGFTVASNHRVAPTRAALQSVAELPDVPCMHFVCRDRC